MTLFKSNKNKTAPATASPAQTPRSSMDALLPAAQITKTARDQALNTTVPKSTQAPNTTESKLPQVPILKLNMGPL
jgi:hypothetical protein